MAKVLYTETGKNFAVSCAPCGNRTRISWVKTKDPNHWTNGANGSPLPVSILGMFRFPLLHPPVLRIPERKPVEPKTAALAPIADPPGPKPLVRADCVSGGFNAARPCQWRSCRYFMGQSKESCALDVADKGEHTLEEVAELLGVSRETVRKIEDAALLKLKRTAEGLIPSYGKD